MENAAENRCLKDEKLIINTKDIQDIDRY